MCKWVWHFCNFCVGYMGLPTAPLSFSRNVCVTGFSSLPPLYLNFVYRNPFLLIMLLLSKEKYLSCTGCITNIVYFNAYLFSANFWSLVFVLGSFLRGRLAIYENKMRFWKRFISWLLATTVWNIISERNLWNQTSQPIANQMFWKLH